MAEVKITQANFESEVLQAENLVIVDFWAPWCGPCRMLGPILEKLDGAYEGKLTIGKVNVDEEEALAVQFDITAIPLVIAYKGGKEVFRNLGLTSFESLDEMVKKVL